CARYTSGSRYFDYW
nr:immunoglobulin heavy chain junction region [Macaca mulatta]